MTGLTGWCDWWKTLIPRCGPCRQYTSKKNIWKYHAGQRWSQKWVTVQQLEPVDPAGYRLLGMICLWRPSWFIFILYSACSLFFIVRRFYKTNCLLLVVWMMWWWLLAIQWRRGRLGWCLTTMESFGERSLAKESSSIGLVNPLGTLSLGNGNPFKLCAWWRKQESVFMSRFGEGKQLDWREYQSFGGVDGN